MGRQRQVPSVQTVQKTVTVPHVRVLCGTSSVLCFTSHHICSTSHDNGSTNYICCTSHDDGICSTSNDHDSNAHIRICCTSNDHVRNANYLRRSTPCYLRWSRHGRRGHV